MADIETVALATRYFSESSAPSTPSTGQGVLYVATDGTLHIIDDAGTDTELGAGGGAVASDAIWDAKGDLAGGTGADTASKLTVGANDTVLTADSAEATGMKWAAAAGGVVASHTKRTAGDVTCNSTTWADVDTGTDMTIACTAGDIVAYSLSAIWGAEALTGYLDVATIVSASPVNYMGTGSTNNGVQAWRCLPGVSALAGGTVFYTIQAGDISGGNVTFRLRYRTSSASNKTLGASTASPLQLGVVNYG